MHYIGTHLGNNMFLMIMSSKAPKEEEYIIVTPIPNNLNNLHERVHGYLVHFKTATSKDIDDNRERKI
mgnify:CR=1 FL=1